MHEIDHRVINQAMSEFDVFLRNVVAPVRSPVDRCDGDIALLLDAGNGGRDLSHGRAVEALYR